MSDWSTPVRASRLLAGDSIVAETRPKRVEYRDAAGYRAVVYEQEPVWRVISWVRHHLAGGVTVTLANGTQRMYASDDWVEVMRER